MLKRSLLCAAVLCGSYSSSHAVDLLASESVAYDKSWGGAYVGLSVGYGYGHTETTFDQGDDNHWGVIAMDPDGFAMSVNAGYNIQSGHMVYGVEGEIGYIDLSDSGQLAWDGHYLKSNVGGFWGTLRGRVGYAADRMMIYGTGGIAFMNFNEQGIGDNGNEDQNSSNSGIRVGYALGVGAEYAFTPRLSGKVEYLHMDFGSDGGHRRQDDGGDCNWTFANEVDLLRVGLNYKLNRNDVDALK
jgi:outer membrane immunogenic protein